MCRHFQKSGKVFSDTTIANRNTLKCFIMCIYKLSTLYLLTNCLLIKINCKKDNDRDSCAQHEINVILNISTINCYKLIINNF